MVGDWAGFCDGGVYERSCGNAASTASGGFTDYRGFTQLDAE